jgi:hypothetical protein
MIPNDEAQELRQFIKSLILNIRMNYGYAMTQAGVEDAAIINIHHMANQKVAEWLEK